MTQIGELETAERSPTVLSQLSRLKHTATRTRRHAESMLVLTGSLPDRSRPRPAAVTDVLRTALAGIEDHTRVGSERSNRPPSAARPSRTSPTWWPSSSRSRALLPTRDPGPHHRLA